ncbi:hypothetical protein HGB13_03920 [bacterium]|jgi:hypothetical protein|nr:hypothetical protein [bacterium]
MIKKNNLECILENCEYEQSSYSSEQINNNIRTEINEEFTLITGGGEINTGKHTQCFDKIA